MNLGPNHEPKLAALEALRSDRLSPAGRARIERHLERCETCRKALAAMELYDQALSDVRASAPPPIAWGKMERALEREARAVIARERRWERTRWYALLAAAAAVAVIWAGPRMAGAPGAAPTVRPLESTTSPVSPVASVVSVAAPIVATVTLVSGRVVERRAEVERGLGVGDVLDEGAVIATDTRSEAHLALGAGGSGMIVHSASAAVLAQMREDEIAIELVGGRLSTVVVSAGFERDARFVVLAAEHRLEARAVRLEVALDPEDARFITLAVAEGEVAVHGPDGSVELVRAPGSWTNRPPSSSAFSEVAVARPHGLGEEAGNWPVLRIEHPDIVEWEVAGVHAEGAGALAMRVEPGEVPVVGFDAQGRAFRTLAIVGSEGLTIGPSELQPEPPRLREGTYTDEDIREVQRRLRAQEPQLERCYARELRLRESVGGRLVLRLRVGLDGSVLATRFVGGEISDTLQRCVQTVADHWTLPPPRGGPVQIDVPLSFQAR